MIIKLGKDGCYALSEGFTGVVKSLDVEVVDTTGAGDAFVSGFVAALTRGEDVRAACEGGNQAGARIVQKLGAVAAWFDSSP